MVLPGPYGPAGNRIMGATNRREFLALTSAVGATLALPGALAATPHRPKFNVDDHGFGSRTERTFTALLDTDESAMRFAFVSCQNVNMGYSTPYRRMILDDAQRAPEDRVRFVLHLGDFIYEMVWYPEDRPRGLQGRVLRDTFRMPHGKKIGDLHTDPLRGGSERAVGRAPARAPARAFLPDPVP